MNWRPSHAFSILVFSMAVLFSLACRAGDDGKDPKPAAEIPTPKKTPSASPKSLFTAGLEELLQVKVTTVSRVVERIDESPGSVYAYSRDVIQKRGYRSLGELLLTVPGFTVFHRDLDFVTGVRGLNANDNEKVTLLVNGQNLNGPHEHDFLNGPINLDNVERVEVIVGPSSFFQPANTLAATVNVITKVTNGVEVIGAVGNDLPYSGTLMAGKRWANDKFISFSFTTENKEGFDAWSRDFRENLAGQKSVGALLWPSYFSVLQGQYGELSGQMVAYRSAWPELHIENGSPQNHGEMVEQKYSLYLKHEHAWTPALTTVFSVDGALKEQTRLNTNGQQVDSVEQSVHQWAYTADMGIRYKGFKRHMLQAGIQGSLNHNFDTYFTFHNTSPSEDFLRSTLTDDETYGAGVYVDDNFQVTDRIKLIGGVRIDHNTKLSGNRWFPGARTAIIAQPKSFWITKLMYNRAVRMPSDLSALNTQWGSEHLDRAPFFAQTSPQPLEPEILSTMELQNIFYFHKLRLSTTVYHQDLKDFITWFAPHSNGGDFSGSGMELSLQGQVHPRLTLWANASYDDSTLKLFNDELFGTGASGVEEHHSYVNPQDRIIGSAKITANLGLDYKIIENLTFAPALRYFTDQAAVDHTSNEYIAVRHRAYLDATLRWNNIRGKNLDASLSARNILDNRSPIGSNINGDTYRPRGREVVFSLSLRFW